MFGQAPVADLIVICSNLLIQRERERERERGMKVAKLICIEAFLQYYYTTSNRALPKPSTRSKNYTS